MHARIWPSIYDGINALWEYEYECCHTPKAKNQLTNKQCNNATNRKTNKQAIIMWPSVPTNLDVLMLFNVCYAFFLSFAKSSGRYFVKRRSWGGVGAHAENSIGPVTPIEPQCFVSSQPHRLSSPIWFHMFLDFHISYRLHVYRLSFSHFYYTYVTPRTIEPQCFVSSQPYRLSSQIWFFLDFHISYLLYVYG